MLYNKCMESVKIKVEVWKRPDKYHLYVQTHTRAQVYKAGKGKGSYKRVRYSVRDY